jgi:hypothetical protein
MGTFRQIRAQIRYLGVERSRCTELESTLDYAASWINSVVNRVDGKRVGFSGGILFNCVVLSCNPV